MYDDYKIIVFNDAIGRTCFGELAGETKNEIKIKDPAIIMVSPNPENAQNMKVDVIPLFFAEFIDPTESNVRESIFNYNKNSITVIEVNLSNKIIEHYFTKINIKPIENSVPEIKLFED